MKLFNEIELKSIEEFTEKHKDCYTKNNPNKKPFGFDIYTRSTGIGLSQVIKCNCCSESENFADVGCW